jgi:subtilase family serine protease
MIPRETFVKKRSSLPHEVHETTIAVKQKNLELLHEMLMERSTPGSPKYQDWMTSDSINKLSSNPEGVIAIKKWLSDNNISVVHELQESNYIRASCTISTWERVLDTKFYYWEDRQIDGLSSYHHRALSFKVPESVSSYIHAIFKVSQPPPLVNPRMRTKKAIDHLEATISSNTKISFLNSLYGISSNAGT